MTSALQHEVGHALLGPADLDAMHGFWPDGIPPALAATIRRSYFKARQLLYRTNDAKDRAVVTATTG